MSYRGGMPEIEMEEVSPEDDELEREWHRLTDGPDRFGVSAYKPSGDDWRIWVNIAESSDRSALRASLGG